MGSLTSNYGRSAAEKMHILKPENVGKDNLPEAIDLFLAGGIRNTTDWQSEAVDALADLDGFVANPRRPEGILTTGPEATKQIEWEFEALSRSKTVLFWFPDTSICPIALYELGVQVGRGGDIIVGAAPAYERRFDLIQQLALARTSNPGLDSAIRKSLASTVRSYIKRPQS